MTSMDEQNAGHHLFVVNRIEDERRIIPSRITGEKAPPTCWVFKKKWIAGIVDFNRKNLKGNLSYFSSASFDFGNETQ